MRLHRLVVTAFGPFPDTVSIDFDQLCADGLFLVHGETGAGKTSVLDAVCFALYGKVPGQRDDAHTLHSHHAPPDRGPQVRLDVSLSNRRLRITRTPKWLRPRRRGNGDPVEENSHVRLEQVWPGGAVKLLSSDHREVADLLADELGLDMAQFCQVVMLPQGGFAEFLRASQDQREQLLKTLFGTEVFSRVEKWLADHRTRMYQKERAAQENVRSTVDRIAEQAEVDAFAVCDDASAADDLAGWARGLHADSSACAGVLQTERDHAARVEQQAVTALSAAERQTQRRRQHAAAQQELRELAADQPRYQRWLEERSRAHAAAPLIPVLNGARDRAEDADRALAAATTALHDVPRTVIADTDPTQMTPADVEQAERRSRDLLVETKQAVEQEREQHRIDKQINDLTDQLATLNTQLETAERGCKELPERQSELTAQLATATTQAGRLPTADAVLASTTQLAKQVARRDKMAADLVVADEDRRIAVDEHQKATDRYQQIRTRRLAGMATELAHGLHDGQPCPVCGSPDHPHPANTAAAVAADDEDAAAQQVDAKLKQRQRAENRQASLHATLTELRAVTGDVTAEHVADQITAAKQQVRTAKRANSQAERLAAEVSSLSLELDDARAQSATLSAERSAIQERLRGLSDRRDALVEAIARTCGADPTLRRRINRLTREADALAKARKALTAWHQSHHEVARAQTEADHAISASPFPDADHVRRAHLTDDGILALDTKIADFDARGRAATQQVNDPDLVAATREPVLNVDQARAAHQQAQDQHRDLHTRHAQQQNRAARLAELSNTLDQQLSAWRPARREYQTANQLAQLVAGKAGDARVTLSTYVLISRFQHVIAAANVRLLRMTTNRYSLAYTPDADNGRRRVRDGLGLTVNDTWTSQPRKPATLSGGETFQVSLALALGLRDVVTAESGGTQIHTLFIDEGFGTLDDEALDQVISTLDELRAGGRVVGIVSHVGELRRRIPTRLHIRKTPAGSAATIHTQPDA